VTFTWEQWWNGSYQQAKNSYLNDQGGFRADLVRVNNELDYLLFEKLHSNSVVMGKQHCLFQRDYISAYYGKDFIGYDKVLAKVAKLKALQDTLGRLGKSLILVHAPCKAFFYPENIPDDLVEASRGTTNYEAYLKLADSMKVNQLDFNAWFVAMKAHSKDVLYPLQGIHWSVYGSLLAADSLITYIEHLRHITMPHLELGQKNYSEKAQDPDDDVNKALNLIVPVTKERFTYPEVKCQSDSGKTKPRVLYIGDSFIMNFLHDNLMGCTNTDWEFWFYNNLVLTQQNNFNPSTWTPMGGYPWQEKLLQKDCIVILYTSHNMRDLGSGFIEKAYDHFYPAGK
jgi:hypothetical protein